MKPALSRCLAAVLVALPAMASARAQHLLSFQGTAVVASAHGNRISLSLAGKSTALGACTGAIDVAVHGLRSSGRLILVAPSGHELQLAIDVGWDPSLPGQRGTFSVLGGT